MNVTIVCAIKPFHNLMWGRAPQLRATNCGRQMAQKIFGKVQKGQIAGFKM